jgi:hypothetical protein
MMTKIFIKHWTLILTLIIFWIIVATVFALLYSKNQAHFSYTFDDTYIHLAMVKNLVNHGVWGIHSAGFTSTSSSPLWTLLLALIYYTTGLIELVPFILNIIICSLIIISVNNFLTKKNIQPIFLFPILLSIIFFTPLPFLVFSGLEHPLHILLTIFFVHLSGKILSAEKTQSKEYLLLLVVSFFITISRYEALFLVFIVSLLFVVRRRYSQSLLLIFVGISPITIYGIISLINGWYFLPNSVLLKGTIPDFKSLQGIFDLIGYTGYKQLISNLPTLFLILISLTVFFIKYTREKKLWKDYTIMLIILIITILLHVQFGKLGFNRYEAYLISLGFYVLASAGCDGYLSAKFSLRISANTLPKYLAIILFSAIIFMPFITRGRSALVYLPNAANNIYEQQYQMGLFLNRFCSSKTVAANDIGAINYLADIKCVDLFGLASIEVAVLKRAHLYNKQKIYALTKQKNVQIALLYDSWFDWGNIGGLPESWVKVGQWKIPDNYVCGDDVVSFYAVDSLQINELSNYLKLFSPSLPKDVIQLGSYTK